MRYGGDGWEEICGVPGDPGSMMIREQSGGWDGAFPEDVVGFEPKFLKELKAKPQGFAKKEFVVGCYRYVRNRVRVIEAVAVGPSYDATDCLVKLPKFWSGSLPRSI